MVVDEGVPEEVRPGRATVQNREEEGKRVGSQRLDVRTFCVESVQESYQVVAGVQLDETRPRDALIPGELGPICMLLHQEPLVKRHSFGGCHAIVVDHNHHPDGVLKEGLHVGVTLKRVLPTVLYRQSLDATSGAFIVNACKVPQSMCACMMRFAI